MSSFTISPLLFSPPPPSPLHSVNSSVADLQILSATVSHLSSQFKKTSQNLGDESSWDQLLGKNFKSSDSTKEKTVFEILDDVDLLMKLLDVEEISKLTTQIGNANSSKQNSSKNDRDEEKASIFVSRLQKSNQKLEALVFQLNQKLQLVEPILEQRFFERFWRDEQRNTSEATNALIKTISEQTEALEKRSQENENEMMSAIQGLRRRLNTSNDGK
jgi:hypothetical protein